MKVYVIFDPAGIWELGEAIYATREAAQRVVDEDQAKRSPHNRYRLRVEEYAVQE